MADDEMRGFGGSDEIVTITEEDIEKSEATEKETPEVAAPAVEPPAPVVEPGDKTATEAKVEKEPKAEVEPAVDEGKAVPFGRFAKEMRKRRALEARLAELEKGGSPKEPVGGMTAEQIAEYNQDPAAYIAKHTSEATMKALEKHQRDVEAREEYKANAKAAWDWAEHHPLVHGDRAKLQQIHQWATDEDSPYKAIGDNLDPALAMNAYVGILTLQELDKLAKSQPKVATPAAPVAPVAPASPDRVLKAALAPTGGTATTTMGELTDEQIKNLDGQAYEDWRKTPQAARMGIHA